MSGANDPLLLERVRESFSRQSFMGLIGAEVIHASHGKVVLDLPFRADLCQQNGFLHGGVVGAIADVAGGYAAYSVFGDGDDVQFCVGIGNTKIEFEQLKESTRSFHGVLEQLAFPGHGDSAKRKRGCADGVWG